MFNLQRGQDIAINLSSKGNNLMGPRFKVSLERHSLRGGGIINIQNDTNTVRQLGSKYVVLYL